LLLSDVVHSQQCMNWPQPPLVKDGSLHVCNTIQTRRWPSYMHISCNPILAGLLWDKDRIFSACFDCWGFQEQIMHT
jgi:hypothetical protein